MRKRFFFKILLIKLLSCLFAVFIFSRFTQLADAERYINASFTLSLSAIFDRTYFTDNFYAFLALFTGKGVVIHLVTATFVSLCIWHTFKNQIRFLPKTFWLLLILPFFAIWTSVVGKEALATCAFLLIVKWVADVILIGRSNILLLMLGIMVGIIVRPNYAVPYVYMATIVYFFLYGRKQISLASGVRYSVGVYSLAIVSSFILLIALLATTTSKWEHALQNVMEISASYFLSYDGGSNRLDIVWNNPADFFYNMYWGIPISIIGPTPAEVVQKPILLPFFIEGIITAILLLYYIYILFKLSFNNYRIRFFFYIAFIPAVCLALLIHYPLGVFNPGSAMRYKQSLIPLFYFLPILIISMYLKAKNNETQKINVTEK